MSKSKYTKRNGVLVGVVVTAVVVIIVVVVCQRFEMILYKSINPDLTDLRLITITIYNLCFGQPKTKNALEARLAQYCELMVSA